MRVTAANARHCFEPLIGRRAWRASLGWGSFLTFEFGPRVNSGGFQHGIWHLWVYMCSWRLYSKDGLIVTSNTAREFIGRIVPRLAAHPLSDVKIENRARSTTFEFGKSFSLNCTPFDRQEEANRIDPADYWMLFMPRGMVLTVRPGCQISIQRSDRAPYRE